LPSQRAEQIHHLVNKIFVIGYLLHRYKDKSRAWCPYGMDYLISEVGESNGRSGKSIYFEALFNLMKSDCIGGRNREVFENKHVFENITEHTDFILIDDAHQYLDLDFLIDKITGQLPVNPKFNAGYKLTFEKSPKFAITSNHGVRNMDTSKFDRFIFLAFSDWYHVDRGDGHYHETHKPIDDFGKMLFGVDYTADDWNEDLNFFAYCIAFYLSRPSPERINPPMENVNIRNIKAEIGEAFEAWADGYFSEANATLDTRVKRQEAFEHYMKETNIKGTTSKGFTVKLKKWCIAKGYKHNPPEICDKNGRMQRVENGKTYDLLFIATKEFTEEDLLLCGAEIDKPIF
jgi:hypothetical protein